MNVITIEEARSQGLTGTFLRTVARSLERIARSPSATFSVSYKSNLKGDIHTDEVSELTNFDPKVNFRNSYELRKIAKELDKEAANG